MKRILGIALATIVLTASLVAQLPPNVPEPTCNPNDPTCTMDNGCGSRQKCNPKAPQFKFSLHNFSGNLAVSNR
jgi:hypothetical protein